MSDANTLCKAEVEQDVSLDCMFEQMDGSLNQLFNSLEALTKVTSQFVRPDETDDEAEKEIKVPKQHISPVANTVSEFVDKIRMANSGLNKIINRVDSRQ